VTVRLNDLVYTGQSSGNEFWNFDPTRLVINDPIAACVSTDTLHLRRTHPNPPAAAAIKGLSTGFLVHRWERRIANGNIDY
jgi:hypothetical protein